MSFAPFSFQLYTLFLPHLSVASDWLWRVFWLSLHQRHCDDVGRDDEPTTAFSMALLSSLQPEGSFESRFAFLFNIRRFLVRYRRLIVTGLMLFLLFILFMNDTSINQAADLVNSAQGRLGVRHPIEMLHARAEQQFKALLERQSKTPLEAEETYRKRYGRTPPPGFKQWAQYAIAARSPIIDDYDIIDDAVAPYYSMTPKHFVELMFRASLQTPRDDVHEGALALCEFVDGGFNKTPTCRGDDWFNDMEATLPGGIGKNIPDMAFVINYLDEPSVLASEADEFKMTWENKRGKSLAKEVHQACALLEGKTLDLGRRAGSPVENFGIPFVQDWEDSKNVCKHPEMLNQHGIYVAPGTADILNVRAPILSTGKPYPFADIVIPSPQYMWQKNLIAPANDIGWKEKKRAVYWAGSTTGSFATNDREKSWRNSHRQRFASRFAEPRHPNLTFGETTYLRRSNYLKTYEPYTSDQVNADLYHVRLTGLIQCEEEACKKQAEYFAGAAHEGPEKAFEYRFNFDIDGNAYTNRFYRLLGSHSVPLKMTLWREWHDERLIPWLHYVPVSVSFDEVPEMVRFLATTDEGDRISEKISKAGAEWHDRALAGIHQGIYLYRLLLELAWLQDPARIPVSVEELEARKNRSS
jgi:hypothetical protein